MSCIFPNTNYCYCIFLELIELDFFLRPQSYERERISARIDEFVHLMRRRDIFELMFELRGGIGRNKFGLLHEGLFSKAMAGSKVLVET